MMELGMKVGWRGGAVALCVLAVAAGTSGCSRDHIEAINLANQADQALKVNVSGAIKDYEEATRLDPTNHRIFWKLANAYHKQEEWDKMASTLARASQVAPNFANYAYNRGFALMKIAEGMLEKQMYRFDDASERAFAEYIAIRQTQPQFANARSVRNAIDRIKLRQAARLMRGGGVVSERELQRIDEIDVRQSRVFTGG